MFLAIIVLFQTKLPCSTNYYRYKNNYEKYINEGDNGDGEDSKKDGDGTNGGVVKKIASPKLMSKASSINSFVKTNNIVVSPAAQRGLLKYAVNNDKIIDADNDDKDPDDSDAEQDYSKFNNKKEIKAKRAERMKELEEMKNKGQDNIDRAEANRLNNRI